MNLKTVLKPIAAAGVGLALMTGTAAAAEATASVNVRSGPSTSYGVVDVLRSGERVNVERCRSNGWCYITHRGPDGWVSSNYLEDDGYGRGYRYRERDRADRDYYYRGKRYYYTERPGVSIQFGSNGFGFSFGNTNSRYPDCIRRDGRVYCAR